MSRPDEFGGGEPRGAESLSSRSGLSDVADVGREVDLAEMDDLRGEDSVGEDDAEEAVEGLDMLLVVGDPHSRAKIKLWRIQEMGARSSGLFCDRVMMARRYVFSYRDTLF